MGRLVLVAAYWGVVVSWLTACESRPSEGPAPAIVAWRPAALGSQTLLGDVGSDCSAAGAPSCRTEICLHVSEFHDRGHFCSSICRKQENCPVGWPCGPVLAGMTERVCVPPGDWDGGHAVIAEVVDLPPAPPPVLIQTLIDGGAP